MSRVVKLKRRAGLQKYRLRMTAPDLPIKNVPKKNVSINQMNSVSTVYNFETSVVHRSSLPDLFDEDSTASSSVYGWGEVPMTSISTALDDSPRVICCYNNDIFPKRSSDDCVLQRHTPRRWSDRRRNLSIPTECFDDSQIRVESLWTNKMKISSRLSSMQNPSRHVRLIPSLWSCERTLEQQQQPRLRNFLISIENVDHTSRSSSTGSLGSNPGDSQFVSEYSSARMSRHKLPTVPDEEDPPSLDRIEQSMSKDSADNNNNNRDGPFVTFNSADGEEVYYVGIIDFITPYDFKRYFHTAWKYTKSGGPFAGEISPVPPVYYATRQIKFVRQHVVQNTNCNNIADDVWS